jgi:hypothetical protein
MSSTKDKKRSAKAVPKVLQKEDYSKLLALTVRRVTFRSTPSACEHRVFIGTADPRPTAPTIQAPHIDGFDYFVEEGLDESVRLLNPVDLVDHHGNRVTCWFESVKIGSCGVLPKFCREMGETYKARTLMSLASRTSVGGIWRARIRACAVAQAPMFATLGTRLEGGFSSTVQVRGLSASVSLAR